MSSAICLYLDHDVDVKLAERLKAGGFDVVTTRDVFGSHSQRTDSEQLQYAARHWRAILTHNRRDFLREHVLWQQKGWDHWGVITSSRLTLDELEQRVLRMLSELSRDNARNLYFRLHLFQ